MNVNDGTPASTAAEENSSQRPFETEAPETTQASQTAQADETAQPDETAQAAETPQVSETAESAPVAASDAAADDAAADGTATEDAATADGEDPAETSEERLRRLEEEGDIAADYLEELLDIADLDGDMDIDVDGDRASLEIRGADRLVRLNRPKGELLDALQELARLAVQTRTGQRSRLMLDIGGFRAEHKNSLEELAATAIAEAKEAGSAVPMRAMNPFERKVVHDVAKREGLRSESDGDGKNRHVVIYPAS
ncbi:MAG: R3H domain-containing nucleic acid-binding protein [Brachybacterium sp.]|uniref:Jag family protein n=1 Tax=Brachybacterium sp. TaxID=1891286 RepID=UPI00264B0C54|nr:RNA-binding protein [Brachybacterium sp.]MDN6301495.1 RNA-binding protein [Brachybacterium sp.]MDN6328817.1 RNA-binding protein [Brachybacterium sp.]